MIARYKSLRKNDLLLQFTLAIFRLKIICHNCGVTHLLWFW